MRVHRSNSARHKFLHRSDEQTGSKARTDELTAIHAVTENAWRMGLLEEDEVGALALQHARTHLAVRRRALLAHPSNTWECTLIAVGRGRNPPSCTFQNIQPHHAQNILQDPPTLPGAWHVDNKLPANTNNLLSHLLAIALGEVKLAPPTTSRMLKRESQAIDADRPGHELGRKAVGTHDVFGALGTCCHKLARDAGLSPAARLVWSVEQVASWSAARVSRSTAP